VSEWKIPPRLGVEVYLTQGNRIGITQSNPHDEDSIIVVHPDDISTLIGYLETAKQKLAGILEEEASE